MKKRDKNTLEMKMHITNKINIGKFPSKNKHSKKLNITVAFK